MDLSDLDVLKPHHLFITINLSNGFPENTEGQKCVKIQYAEASCLILSTSSQIFGFTCMSSSFFSIAIFTFILLRLS